MGVRPDLDLPHRLHGTVLDVADDRDEDHRDTYQYLIRKGLAALENDSSEAAGRPDAGPYWPAETDYITRTPDEEDGDGE